MAMSSPWFELLDDRARSALKPTSSELPNSAEVVVIGGGVAGLAAAAMCSRAGIKDVVLLERGERLAGETSNGVVKWATTPWTCWSAARRP